MASNITLLFNAQSGTTATPAAEFPRAPQDAGRLPIAQVSISATATVVLEGRLSADFPWFTILTFTSSDAATFHPMPEMRGRITANTGTVTLGVVR